ncbi:peptidoglycan DD-metalloendopeptidase family protein [Aquibium microcysteis]|uniref:peptidoglycan DD-metalloendopeptidase family protein n=1 Tax=Aquibium microcysteis TaxID=675281 RepID=UPI001EF38901|nr:peptidoglycan DD-metalloendopeptidase family protein [Aquibium microcysteis]
MRMRVSGAYRRGLSRFAVICATTTVLAGCSSGVTRFNEGIFTDQLLTGSTANQRSIIRNGAAQPFPGDVRTASAPVAAPSGGQGDRYAVAAPAGGIQRSSLPPMAAAQPAPVQPAPVQQASLQPAPVQLARGPAQVDRMATGTAGPAVEVAATDSAQQGWSKVGGTVVAVRQGETLYNMSKRFGVPVKEILKANDMASASELAAGQKVVIPTYVYSRQAPVSAPDNDPQVAAASSTRGLKNDAPTAPRPAPAPAQAVAVLPQTPRPKDPAMAPATANTATRVATSNAGNVYTVVSGDTLNSVARKTGATTAQLKAANNLGDGYLRIGQKLTVPAGGTATVAAAKPATPSVDPITTSSAPAAKAHAPSPVTAYTPPTRDEKVIKEAVTQTAAIAPEATGVGKMRWPVRGRVIEGYGRTAGGRTNDGIDIAVPEGTPVKAAENGVVIYAGDGLKEFGNTVLVRHEDGLVSVYGHASELNVKRGDKVRRGQEIARSGMSGSADTPKLHFEVRKDSAPVDPSKFLE